MVEATEIGALTIPLPLVGEVHICVSASREGVHLRGTSFGTTRSATLALDHARAFAGMLSKAVTAAELKRDEGGGA